MIYFDIEMPFVDNAKHYKTLCKKLHPDMPTGNKQSFIEMKGQWDEYNIMIENKKKVYTDFYTEQSINPEKKGKDNEIQKVIRSIFETAKSDDIIELKAKLKKFKNQTSALNFLDLFVTTIKFKNKIQKK